MTNLIELADRLNRARGERERIEAALRKVGMGTSWQHVHVLKRRLRATLAEIERLERLLR